MKALAFRRRDAAPLDRKQPSKWVHIAALVVMILVIAVPTALLWTRSALALTNQGPDPADFSTHRVVFAVDDAGFVNAHTSSILSYFPAASVNFALQVASAGLVNPGQYDTTYGGSNVTPASVVTTYTLQYWNGAAFVGFAPARVCLARATTLNCNFNGAFPAAAAVDTDTGYKKLQLTAAVNPLVTHIQNGFYIGVSAGAIVGFDSKSSATNFAMQDTIGAGSADWYLKFGTDCSKPLPANVTFTYFDPDNGTSGIQTVKTYFAIYDDTLGFPGSTVRFTSWGGDDFTTGASPASVSGSATLTPGDNSGTTGFVTFSPVLNHTYYVKWFGVDSGNTLQFQLPFDSIFHETKGCAPPPPFTLAATNVATQAFVLANTSYTNLFQTTLRNTGPNASQKISDVVTNTSTPAGSISSFTVNGGSDVLAALPPPPALGSNAPSRSIDVNVGNVPPGSQVCVTYTVSPYDQTGLVKPLQACVTVIDLITPSIVGTSGDIHAGGGKGNCPGSTANITTKNGSIGQYVVAASGTVNSLSSNNSLGSKAATLENYLSVCRPDLVTAANSYLASVPAGFTKTNVTSVAGYAGGKISVSALNTPNTVYYANNALTLTGGNIGANKITLVTLNKLTITGDIGFAPTGNHNGADQPSLGIISAGEVDIAGSAHNISAYIFSDASIDTCYDFTTAGRVYTNLCANMLHVDGFLMAQSIGFHRFGVPPASGLGGVTTAEEINLLPQLYLNPPTLFGSLATATIFNNQGERPPLQ